MSEIDQQSARHRGTGPEPLNASARHRFMSGSTEINLDRVLSVVADFAGFHDCSMELVAWELSTSPLPVGRLWRAALEQGLLETTGSDEDTGERIYTLTDAGWRRLGRTPSPTRGGSLRRA